MTSGEPPKTSEPTATFSKIRDAPTQLTPMSRGRLAHIRRSQMLYAVSPGPMQIEDMPRLHLKQPAVAWLASTEGPAPTAVEPGAKSKPNRRSYVGRRRGRASRDMRRASRLAYQYPRIKVPGHTASVVLFVFGMTVFGVAMLFYWAVTSGWIVVVL